MRGALVVLLLSLPATVFAQTPGDKILEVLQHKPLHPTIEPIAPTGGFALGIGLTPAAWKPGQARVDLRARASLSVKKYAVVDASLGWQRGNSLRIEPYVVFREMKQLPFFGLGNNSSLSDASTFDLLERRLGVTGWKRPIPAIALGGRIEGLWPRTLSGGSSQLRTTDHFVHVEGFVDFNHPTGLNERPRHGGDYRATFGAYRALGNADHSFNRVDLEGQERFTVAGRDRLLTIHGIVSTSYPSQTDGMPFYLMSTLGGADNLRGFRESNIGIDQGYSSLRAFKNFRFRDANLALAQVELRQRIWSQVFLIGFADAGAVSRERQDLLDGRFHRGYGISVAVMRSNVTLFRFDFSFGGGEGRHYYPVIGKGITP